MKKKIAIFACAAALVACVGILAGCSSTDSKEEEETVTTEPEAETDPDPTEEAQDEQPEEEPVAETEEILGMVRSLEDTTLEITVYDHEYGDAIADYTAVETDAMTATEETQTVTLDGETVYYTASLEEADREDLTEGTMIAVTVSGDTAVRVVLLPGAETEAVEEETVSVVEVIAVAEDGTLTVALYAPAADAAEITNYAAVELENYEATGEAEDRTLEDSTVVSLAEDGALVEASAGDIAVGNMLVCYTDADGNSAVVIYPQTEADA